jgi:hypothetical protein
MLGGAAALLLAGCGAAPDSDDNAAVAAIDQSLTGNTPAGDPALMAALHDQIMVDPALVQQANDDVIRPPTRPVSGAVPPDDIAAEAMTAPGGAAAGAAGIALRSAPAASEACHQCTVARESLTLGALAARQGRRAGQCAANVGYSAGWANRLPAATPLYPDARVTEAAGADGAGCALRIVSFASAAPVQRMLDWYFTRTGDAGYRAEHKADGAEHTLAGTNPKGGAFLVVVRARKDGGSDVDLMADGG